ncbi:hypothetical protein [Sphingosinithalassobacter portus]|uniref:hypothetical protein n=1 Tax=Stakelama portus TaxID=2676234 RepID=UPI001EFD80F6|nr:hypothetical protein [Sphingosinithalassobacter portus]
MALLLLLLAACAPGAPPPPNRAYGGMPITGSLAFARQMGFSDCVDTATTLRCRKRGMMVAGQGPFEGGLDLYGDDGASGFQGLTLWHDADQRAVFGVEPFLKARGWTLCRTGTEDRGDQNIWTKPGSPVRYSIDMSYWGKRRLRVLIDDGTPPGPCL